MSYKVNSGIVETEKITINEIELSNRLKTKVGFTNEEIEKCKQELLKVIEYKYAYVKVPVDLSTENYVNLNFVSFNSKNLYKNLSGCKEAYVFSVTVGIGVDRLLSRLNLLSQSRHFITDALSSAAVESFCDYVNEMLAKNKKTKPRFSPGYGDLPLEIQPDILKVLSADKTLGITLNESLFMTPVKSITAIMGVL